MAAKRKDLKGLHVLITAGPTREYIDPVRFLSNPSSGRMGYALAAEAQARGAKVTLVSGPTELPTPRQVKRIDVVSADEMYHQTLRHFSKSDIVIMTAAVADYRPRKLHTVKQKKTGRRSMTLKLVATKDILATLGKKKSGQFVVGFAAETDRLIANAKDKLKRKNLDMIVANRVGRKLGFEVPTNQATLIFPHGPTIKLPRMSKARLAAKILATIQRERCLFQ